ncbi:MAG: AraC family transcriptional regulator [Chloroflexota bacterium]
MIKLREVDYFDAETEMHYALLQSAETIGPNLHTHQFFEIFLLIEGEIQHIVNGHHLTLIEGSMTLIRPQDAHYYRPVKGRNCQIINLAIARQAINDLFAFLGEGFHAQRIVDRPLPPTVNLAPGTKRQVQIKFEQLHSIPMQNISERRTALRILLFELITHYFPLALRDSGEEGLPFWLQQACEAMQKPENMVGGVPRMLELAAVSAEHLARTARKYLRQTPTAYVNQLRLTYAANLLTHGDQDILNIATEVGFESLSYFYTLFKRHYGQTPRQFRQTHMPQMPHTDREI